MNGAKSDTDGGRHKGVVANKVNGSRFYMVVPFVRYGFVRFYDDGIPIGSQFCSFCSKLRHFVSQRRKSQVSRNSQYQVMAAAYNSMMAESYNSS